MQQKKPNKKAQEEMVGFVMIVVLVAIIFLVFLSIIIRKNSPSVDQNAEISQFLDATVTTTTSCSLNGYHFLSFSELIDACASGAALKCDSGEQPCSLLKTTYQSLIEQSWNFNPTSPNPGYTADITSTRADGTQVTIIKTALQNGAACATFISATKPIFTQAGTATLSLKKCLP